MHMIKRGVELLRTSRNFAFLMGTQFLAQAGDGIVQAALAKQIAFGGQKGFDLEGARSPDELLRSVLYIMVPYTILSPFLGVLIDRWDRRRLLIAANGGRAVVIGLVGLVGTGRVPDGVLFIAFLLTLASTRLVLATKAAALPVALGDRNLMEGNAVSQLGGALFQLGGGGLALIAAAAVSASPIVIAGALVYGAGTVCAARLTHVGEARARMSLGEQLAHVAREIGAGLREVAHTPKAGAAISTYFWLRWLWSFSLVGIGFVARELLDEDMAALIITGGAGAVGAGLGFLLADRLRARVGSTAHLVLGASALAGVAVAALGGFSTSASIAVLAFGLGLGFFLAKISLDTLVQEALGDDFRGRAFSLYDIAYNTAWVLAAAVMQVLWAPDLEGRLIAGMGVVFLAGLAGLAAWFKRAGLLEAARPVATRTGH